VLVGAGMGIFASPNRATIMSSVPSYRRGIAAGISTMLVMTGSAFSIGIVFAIFTQYLSLHEAQNLFSGSFVISNFNDLIEDKFMDALHFIFYTSAILMISSIILSIIKWNFVKG
jgi:MFS family permease